MNKKGFCGNPNNLIITKEQVLEGISTIVIISVILFVILSVGISLYAITENYQAYCDLKFGEDNWYSEYNYSTLFGHEVYSCIENK